MRKLHSQASGRKRRTHTSASIECIPSAPTVGRDLGKGRSAQRFPAFTVDGLPSRHATTSTRGRSGRSAGARTTPAPTTAPHPAVAWPPQSEPSSKLAAHLGRGRAARREDVAWFGGNTPAMPWRTLGRAVPASPGKPRWQAPTEVSCSHCCIIDWATRSVDVSWPWRLLEGVEADHRTGQHRQSIEASGVSLISDAQPPSQAPVRSIVQRWRPSRVEDSIMRRAMRGLMPRWRR